MRRISTRIVVGTLAVATLAPAAVADATPQQGCPRALVIDTAGISVSQIGTFRPRRDPTIAAAIRAFGRPTSRRVVSGGCRVRWQRLRLRIDFVNLGGTPPGRTVCSLRVGKAQTFVARGRRFVTWEGLRVGHHAKFVPQFHREAEFRGGAWWLKPVVSPFGPEGTEFSVVRAFEGPRGRVSAFDGYIGAAGE